MDKLAKLIGQVEKLEKMYVKAGLCAKDVETNADILERAIYNEFGTAFIPARPFLRITDRENRKKWAKRFCIHVKNGIRSGNLNAERIYEDMGNTMFADILATIDSNVPPPNSPETIRRKLKRGAIPQTLVDTGQMRKAIGFEVLSD